MCYVRSGIFFSVFLVAVFLICRVGVTTIHTSESNVKNMNMVLFAVLFFVLLCGFDFFYELFNMQHDDGRDETSRRRIKIKSVDKRWMHTLFVFVYVAFANFITHADFFAGSNVETSK